MTPYASHAAMPMATRPPDVAVLSCGSASPPTLLPLPVAHAVSLATRSTSLAIRVGSLVGTYGLDAARFTTVSSLALARGMLEGVLARAASDAHSTASSLSYAASEDTESLLERSLDSLRRAVSQAVFWTSAGFRLTGTTLTTASDASLLVLSSLDQLFGSTDSSRAAASIITLLRREFRQPSPATGGQAVGIIDLVLALAALAYLQRACRRLPSEELRRRNCEEVIWDIVVLNDGQRIDVQQDAAASTADAPPSQLQGPQSSRNGYEDEDAILARLKGQIVASLAPGTSVAMSSSVSSVQTITVDVRGSQLPAMPTPPGAEIVETRGPISTALTPHSWTPAGQEADESYRVVYKIQRDNFQSTSFRRDDQDSSPVVIELLSDEASSPTDSSKSQSLDNDVSKASHFPNLESPGSTAAARDNSHDAPIRKSFAADSPSLATPNVDMVDSGSSSSNKRPLPSTPTDIQPEQTANQKKQRLPPTAACGSRDDTSKARHGGEASNKGLHKKTEPNKLAKPTDKKSGLKHAFKGSGQSLSNMWTKESAASGPRQPAKLKSPHTKPSNNKDGPPSPVAVVRTPVNNSSPSASWHSLANRRSLHSPEKLARPSSRTGGYVSIHERRRDSIVSQTDAFSVNASGQVQSASPTVVRTDYSAQESTARPRSLVISSTESAPPSPYKSHQHHQHHQHRRSASYAASLYSVGTNDSQSSLILSSYYQKSVYNASSALGALRREGFVDGAFPAGHLLPNVARYMRFSSACYGSHFLKVMGISTEMPASVLGGSRSGAQQLHHDVRHFVHHTESEAGSILLASFVDPQGGADASGSTGTGVPLVHYISLDHAARAVVLACRGTLGFEDVVADMTCEYDDLFWRGRRYKVHKGIHASARRLLYGQDGRVLVTIAEALREFPDYGLVLCGHSLGGGVTALLGVMLSQPNPDGPGFVTSGEPHARLLLNMPARVGGDDGNALLRLPAGRRIHVYAYGPPGVMSPSLRRITRGLVTSVVHGNDLVPNLSLGLVHELQALALAFKMDQGHARGELRRRMWTALQTSLRLTGQSSSGSASASNACHSGTAEADEQALGALRESMRGAHKLVPPGEVFAVESTPVLRREAFVAGDEGGVGRPAQRVVLKYIRDVETRFGEVRFGGGMLTDHSPAKYEDALNKLRLGVVE
ncbi:hypothetical protein CDD81_4819 [Ophiocordyceps australis]|uniref:sn-1-specific diacylglycerol lipase n=1 Tax=Ophiocordyceps australis TaxID=1399860 RepID=A0A2C5Y3Y6_9HYPO|nr:hypothetical protein CDD81_4819 [Ophiocordyceps australis]